MYHDTHPSSSTSRPTVDPTASTFAPHDSHHGFQSSGWVLPPFSEFLEASRPGDPSYAPRQEHQLPALPFPLSTYTSPTYQPLPNLSPLTTRMVYPAVGRSMSANDQIPKIARHYTGLAPSSVHLHLNDTEHDLHTQSIPGTISPGSLAKPLSSSDAERSPQLGSGSEFDEEDDGRPVIGKPTASQHDEEWRKYIEGTVVQARCRWPVHTKGSADPILCGFTSRKHATKRHIETTHLKIKRWVCSKCQRTFSQKASLERHVTLHTGEMPFKCTYTGCVEAFNDRARRHRHMVEEHGHVPKPHRRQRPSPSHLSPH